MFEFLVLDGAQAGLSWETILQKRDAYRTSFDGFDIATVAGYDSYKVESLLRDPGIVRNRLKVESAVTNARAVLELQAEVGSFDEYIWGFVGGVPVKNARASMKGIPTVTPASERMSRDLKIRGFKFVGPTICYAFMQAAGMVNDHEVTCLRYDQV